VQGEPAVAMRLPSIKGEVMGQYGKNIVTGTCSGEVTSKSGLKEAINPEYDSPAPFPGFQPRERRFCI